MNLPVPTITEAEARADYIAAEFACELALAEDRFDDFGVAWSESMAAFNRWDAVRSQEEARSR